jgi:hypothetical protein
MNDSAINETSFNGTTSSSGGMNASALQLRFDASRIIENIEMYLRGEGLRVFENNDGQIIQQRYVISNPKANPIGIHSLINRIQAVINSAVVMGNFLLDGKDGRKSSMYDVYIYHAHLSITEMVVTNCYKWEINDDDINAIIDFMMDLIVPFMSRLIDNKEREGLAETVKHVETSNINQRSDDNSPFKFFKR